MKQAFRFLKDSGIQTRRLALAALLSILSSACALIIAEFLRQGIDAVAEVQRDRLLRIVILALVVTLIAVTTDALLKLTKRRYTNDCEQGWQTQLIRKHLQIRKRSLQKQTAGDVVTTILTNAMEGIDLSISAILSLCTGLALLTLSALYMGLLAWQLTALLVLYNLIFRIFFRRVEKGIRESAGALVRVQKENNNFLLSMLRNMLVVRVFEHGGYFKTMLGDKEKSTMTAGIKQSAWHNAMMDGTWAIAKLAEFILIYGVGGILVVRGLMPLGSLIAFVFAADLFVKGIDAYASYLSSKNEAMAHIDSVHAFMAVKDTEDVATGTLGGMVGEELSAGGLAIKIEDMSFGYGDDALLENVSLTIEPGDKVLIKGPNGQGKSTLLKLIAGLYRPDSGVIYFGDAHTSACPIHDLSTVYNMVSQHCELVEGDLPENMALQTNPDAVRVQQTLDTLEMDHVSSTKVSSLSQGEKQRLNIGRALYRDSKALILGDEIFSNVDQANVALIEQRLSKTWEKRTVILVAHEDTDFPFNRVFHVAGGMVQEELVR